MAIKNEKADKCEEAKNESVETVSTPAEAHEDKSAKDSKGPNDIVLEPALKALACTRRLAMAQELDELVAKMKTDHRCIKQVEQLSSRLRDDVTNIITDCFIPQELIEMLEAQAMQSRMKKMGRPVPSGIQVVGPDGTPRPMPRR